MPKKLVKPEPEPIDEEEEAIDGDDDDAHEYDFDVSDGEDQGGEEGEEGDDEEGEEDEGEEGEVGPPGPGQEGEGEGQEEGEEEEAEEEPQDLTDEFPEWSPFLLDRFSRMFSMTELRSFLEAQETPRPVTIRCNSLKIRRRDLHRLLTKRGMHVEPLERWSKHGLQVFTSKVPVGGTPEYLAGYYMVQSAVSFLPVIALAPEEGERILDMASAPGGKTSYIAQLMQNTGVVYANDVNRDRLKSLQANLHRLGVSNVVVCCYDGQAITRNIRNVNRVLLDAPCTGTGVVSRDPSIKASKTYHEIHEMSVKQRKLLLAAIDACNPGGVIVYSTCSVMPEENEAVVEYALKKRDVKLVDTGLKFGRPGIWKYGKTRFNQSVKLCKRFYPHVHNMDGFFIAKFVKGTETNQKKKVIKQKRAEEAAAAAAPPPEQPAAFPEKSKKNRKRGRKRPREQRERLAAEAEARVAAAAAKAVKASKTERPSKKQKVELPTKRNASPAGSLKNGSDVSKPKKKAKPSS